MRIQYLIKYKLYDIDNVIRFSTFSQYQNWLTSMEELNEWGGDFNVTKIVVYDI